MVVRQLFGYEQAKSPSPRDWGFNNQNTLKTILSRQDKQKPNRKIPAAAEIS
jgi:hypothetical protein